MTDNERETIKLRARREVEAAEIELSEAYCELHTARTSTSVAERARASGAAARALMIANRKFACAHVLLEEVGE